MTRAPALPVALAVSDRLTDQIFASARESIPIAQSTVTPKVANANLDPDRWMSRIVASTSVVIRRTSAVPTSFPSSSPCSRQPASHQIPSAKTTDDGPATTTASQPSGSTGRRSRSRSPAVAHAPQRNPATSVRRTCQSSWRKKPLRPATLTTPTAARSTSAAAAIPAATALARCRARLGPATAQAVAAAFVRARSFCSMNCSTASCASSSGIWRGGDFIR